MKTIFLAVLVLILWISNLHAQTPFYQGKTIRLVVGLSAGGSYDQYARLIAQHMGKHIPGNPSLVVQNMPGAGSQIAANYIYTVAKPDGLTLGSIFPSLYFNQLAGRKEVQFDWGKFAYLGSPDRTEDLLHMRADSPFKTIDDVRRASEPPKCGNTGIGSVSHYFPRLLEETIGTKFAIVTGYPGGPEIDLALERGEVQCRALSLVSWFSGDIFRKWRETGFTRVLVQTGRKRDPRLPQVPLLAELMDEYKTPESSRRLASAVLARAELGRPYVGPPGLPGDLVKILRESFVKMMNDAEFLADAKKRNLDIEPTTGEEMERLAKAVIVQPPEVIDRLTKLLAK